MSTPVSPGLPGEAAIREQVRRVFAAIDNYPYEELESHDYQQQAGAVVDMLQPLVSKAGQLAARIAELEAEAAKVAEFVAARAEYITAIRNCHPDNGHDYHRWQGHAESRRQLAETLGLPVAWPAKDGAL